MNEETSIQYPANGVAANPGAMCEESGFRKLKRKMVVTKDEHECMFCTKKIPQDTPALYIVGVRRGRLEAGYICNEENCSGLSEKTWREMVSTKGYNAEFKHGRH